MPRFYKQRDIGTVYNTYNKQTSIIQQTCYRIRGITCLHSNKNGTQENRLESSDTYLYTPVRETRPGSWT